MPAEKEAAAFALFGSALHCPLLREHELANELQPEGLNVLRQLRSIDEPAEEFGVVALAIGLLPDDEGWRSVDGLQPGDVEKRSTALGEGAGSFPPVPEVMQRAAADDQVEWGSWKRVHFIVEMGSGHQLPSQPAERR